MTPSPSPAPLPPGSFGLPFIGETLNFFQDPDYAQKKHAQLGPIFKTRLLGNPTVFIKGAEANQFVLSNDNTYFQVSWPPSTTALLGPLSLALQTGAEHQARRKLLAQVFMPKALSGYIAPIQTVIQDYSQRWAAQSDLVWFPELQSFTLTVACKLFVGLEQGSQGKLGQLFQTWINGLFSLPIPLPWTQFGQAQQARTLLLQRLEAIIQQRQQATEPGTDALGLLVQARDEEGQGFSLAELKDQILLLLFAGHETSTSATASFCLLMAQHRQVWDRLREEQQGFPPEAELTLDHLKQMTYLDQVFHEVLRLIPPVGGGFRTVLQDCELGGYRVPKGWTVLYGINQTHLDTAEYPDPKAFNPERPASASKFNYIPFGGGIRECIGKEFAKLELKLLAIHLLRHYRWELLPDQDLSLVTIPSPRPKDGLRVRFQATA